MSARGHHGLLMGGDALTYLGFDPALKGSNAQMDNGNFDVYTSSGGTNLWVLSATQKAVGKWRQQFLVVNHSNTNGIGFATGTALGGYAGSNAQASCLFGNYGSTLRLYYNGAAISSPAGALVSGDRLDLLIDIAAGKAWWAKNGVVIAGNPAAGTGAMQTFAPGTPVRLCADVTGAAGRIRLLKPSAFTGASIAGFADGWPV